MYIFIKVVQDVNKFLKINFPEYLKIFPEFENSYRFKNNKFVNKFCSFPLCCADIVHITWWII